MKKLTDEDVLTDLYAVYWQKGCAGARMVTEWAQEYDIDRHQVFRAIEVLKEQGYIETRTMDSTNLTSAGVLFAEQQGIASPEQKSHNGHARAVMLDYLAKVREEHGVQGMSHPLNVVSQTEIEEIDMDRNYFLLQDTGMAESYGGGLRITPRGYETVLTWRKCVAAAEAFRVLKSSTTPQKRGHELEVLLQDLIADAGWTCDTNVKSVGEEHDLVIHRDREYYLAECKWEKDPIESGDFYKFFGKLTARAGTNGLFFSMSGYTAGFLDAARDRMQERIVLLFGPTDIANLLSRVDIFSELLSAKFHGAISKRVVLFD